MSLAALLLAAWPLAAASVSGAAPAAPIPASPEAQLRSARGLLDEIDAVLAAVRAGGRDAKESCRASFSAEALSDGLSSGRVPAEVFAALPQLRQSLTSHLTCRSLAADDPAPCAGLDPVEPSAGGTAGARPDLPPAYVCRRDYRLWSYDRARLSAAPDLMQRCLAENEFHRPGDEGPFKPGAYEAGCAAVRGYAEKKLSREQACAALADVFKRPPTAAECADRLRWFFGEDESLCSGQPSEEAVARCRDLVALRRALAAGSARACGGSASCRLLATRHPDCAPSLEQARSSYCSRFVPAYAWRLHAAVSVVLERAAEALAPEAQAGDGSARVRTLAALETRRQAVSAELGLLSSPPPGGAPPVPGAAFADADAALSSVLDAALALEPGAGASCRGEFTVPALLAALGSGRSGDPRLLYRLEQYGACKALVLGGPGACRALDLPAFAGAFALRPDYLCRHHFLMWTHDLTRLSGGAETAEQCAAENYYRWRAPLDGGPFKPGLFREGCAAIAAYSTRGEDLGAVCARALPFYRYSQDPKECVDRFRYAHGEDVRLCDTLDHPRVKPDRCRDLVALRTALKGGRGDCGESFYCRLQLDREPGRCAPFLARLREAACASALLPSHAPSGEPAAELLARARRALEAAAGMPEDGKKKRRAVLEWAEGRLKPR